MRCGYAVVKRSPRDARARLVHFTPRGRRLLATVLELTEEIEGEFATLLKSGEFDRVRAGLRQMADRIDPDGRLGAGDR